MSDIACAWGQKTYLISGRFGTPSPISATSSSPVLMGPAREPGPPFKPEQALNATYPDMNLRLLRYKGALGEFHGA